MRSTALLALMLTGTAPLGDLRNPVARHELLASAEAGRFAQVNREFLAGNWDGFETWAALALAGKLPSEAAPATPHGRYVAALRQAPERDALLRFLLRARPFHAGLAEPLSAPALPPASPEVRAALLRYLAAFEHPASAADPSKVLGTRLVHFSHQPDPSIVGLAGDLGLTEALPHLLRFVAAPRRFYSLHTDYSTSPQPTDALFEESLLALVKLARNAGQAEAVRAALNTEVQRLSKVDADTPLLEGKAGADPVVIEEVHSYEGHSSESVVERRVGPSSPLSRVPRLRWALSLLSDKAHGARADIWALFPEALWLRALELDSALEGRGGHVEIRGSRLYFLEHSLGALDLASGDLVFDQPLDDPGDRGVAVNARTFAFDDTGALLMPAALSSGRSPDRSVALVIDPDTGEVRQELPLTLPASVRHGPDAFGAAGEDLVLFEAGRAWQQSRQGKVRWEHKLPSDAAVRVTSGRVALLSDGRLQLSDASGRALLSRPLAELVTPSKDSLVFEDEVLLGPGVLVVMARYQRLFGLDESGKQLWSAELPTAWSRTPWLCGSSVCALTQHQLSVLALTSGAREDYRSERDLREAAVSEGQVYLLTERELTVIDRKTRRARTLLSHGLSHMAHLAGATPEGVLLQVYLSAQRAGEPQGYYLLLVPHG